MAIQTLSYAKNDLQKALQKKDLAAVIAQESRTLQRRSTAEQQSELSLLEKRNKDPEDAMQIGK